MALTNAFYEAVKDDNVRRVRIMMKDSLLVDPTFTDFNNMVKAASSMTGLYDAHDGRAFISDEQEWNDEYMDKLMVQVVGNFSHERIDHLKDVVRYLRPVHKAGSTSSHHTEYNSEHRTSGNSYQEQKYRDLQNGDYRGAKIAAGAVAGAVVGGVVASVAGVTVVGGVAVGALVGGAAVTVTVNGGKRG